MRMVMGAAGKLGKVACALLGVPLLAGATTDDRDALIRSFSGEFDNQRQYQASDPSLRVPPSIGGRWLDAQHARMLRVEAPGVGSHVLYFEWRGTGPQAAVSRRRVWAFDLAPNGQTTMRYYTVPQSVRLDMTDPASLRSLRRTDLIGYPPACDARFKRRGQGWAARIDPAQCRIVAQSGRAMRLDVTIAVDANGFSYQEKGVLDDGALAFAVPPTEPYRFDRVTR